MRKHRCTSTVCLLCFASTPCLLCCGVPLTACLPWCASHCLFAVVCLLLPVCCGVPLTACLLWCASHCLFAVLCASGMTALHMACYQGWADGAKVTSCPSYTTCCCLHTKLLLKPHQSIQPCIRCITAALSVCLLQLLLEAGGRELGLAETVSDGITPLHLCCGEGHLGCVRLLLRVVGTAGMVERRDKEGDQIHPL